MTAVQRLGAISEIEDSENCSDRTGDPLSSTLDPQIRLPNAVTLKDNHRPLQKKTDTSLLAGRNPVREALEREAERIEKVMIQRGAGGESIRAIRKLAERAGIPVQHVPAERLTKEAPEVNHQGVLAMAAPLTYRPLDAMLAAIAPTWDDVQARKPLLLVVDRVTDTHNFGALLRSAVAAGADGVIVPSRYMAPLNATVLKASAGTARRIPIARTDDLAQALVQLKERGYWVGGADAEGTESVWAADFDRPFALVVGSEGEGLRPEVAAACDLHLTIPMRGPAESLNVSVAAGILLFAAARVRA